MPCLYSNDSSMEFMIKFVARKEIQNEMRLETLNYNIGKSLAFQEASASPAVTKKANELFLQKYRPSIAALQSLNNDLSKSHVSQTHSSVTKAIQDSLQSNFDQIHSLACTGQWEKTHLSHVFTMNEYLLSIVYDCQTTEHSSFRFSITYVAGDFLRNQIWWW